MHDVMTPNVKRKYHYAERGFMYRKLIPPASSNKFIPDGKNQKVFGTRAAALFRSITELSIISQIVVT